jgi:hypothetical protein
MPAVWKRKRVQRVHLVVREPRRSRAAELAAIEMQSAALPNAARSRRRSRNYWELEDAAQIVTKPGMNTT